LDPSIKEVSITEDDTPKMILEKLGLKENFHITDSNGNPFDNGDSLFGYCTIEGNPPVQVLHGSALRTRKARVLAPKKDNRIRQIIAMGDERMVFERGVQPTYALALKAGREANGLPDTWQIERVRAEEDRIFIECADGADASWFSEKACPPLKISEDKIYQDATRVPPGGWGRSVQSHQIAMLTRSKAAAEKMMKKVQVILQNITSGEAFNMGEADSYDKALDLAKKSGKVPKGWNVAVSDANEERINVVCKKGMIVAGEGYVPAVTAPKTKAKAVKVDIPEKLVGPKPDEAFMPKTPIPVVPEVVGQEIAPADFNRIPRPLDPFIGSWNIKVTMKDADTKDLQVRRDVTMVEILAMTFQGAKFEADERVKVSTKPMRMQDGALFRVEKVSLIARLAPDVKIWDGSTRKCGIEVSPNATVAEIVEEAQKRLNDEPL
jgi:hypothetical protein